MSKIFREYLKALKALGDSEEARKLAEYHKVSREYLGVRVPQVTALAKEFAKSYSQEEILSLCPELWAYNAHESRLSVGKLLELPKISNYEAIWNLLEEFKEDLDAWAIADHLTHGADKVLKSDSKYLDIMEKSWLTHSSFWVRRCTLVYTLYLAKKDQIPEKPLMWAGKLACEKQWFIQKAIAWWLRELSKHNPHRVKEFLASHQLTMKAFAIKEASKYL